MTDPSMDPCDVWDEEDQEDEFCDSDFAYQGFGPVCLKYQCEHWAGDSLCDLAIQEQIAETEGKPEPNDFCPLIG